MVDNYRPPQPLNNRIVRRVEEKCRCEHPDGVCARDGTCYVFPTFTEFNYEDADAICDALGMILPEPRSWHQNQALGDLMFKRDIEALPLNIQVSPTDSDTLITMTDGEEISFSKYAEGITEGDCVVMTNRAFYSVYDDDSIWINWECGDALADTFTSEALACQELKYTDVRDASSLPVDSRELP